MKTVDDSFGKIVALTQAEAGMRYQSLAVVRAYWEALRKGRQVPSRAEVDPRGIELALEHAFIAERIAPGTARFRLAGMHLNDLMGMEVRGMPLSSFFAPVARKRFSEVVEAVFQGPEVAEVTLQAEAGIGKPPLTARLLILPLKSDLGDINRALGCLVSEGQIGRSPRRFTITSVQMSRITAGKPVAPGEVQPVDPLRPLPEPHRQPGLAEPARGFAHAPTGTPEARRAAFRIVKDDG
ncbi:MAG: PAS domain-containing protein [Rhodobacteraceae bacterium]|nr:PAS domain-containing protein [Paracoccaceae bacterium]